ncbi:unnamed protein product [Prunus armeniaca]
MSLDISVAFGMSSNIQLSLDIQLSPDCLRKTWLPSDESTCDLPSHVKYISLSFARLFVLRMCHTCGVDRSTCVVLGIDRLFMELTDYVWGNPYMENSAVLICFVQLTGYSSPPCSCYLHKVGQDPQPLARLVYIGGWLVSPSPVAFGFNNISIYPLVGDCTAYALCEQPQLCKDDFADFLKLVKGGLKPIETFANWSVVYTLCLLNAWEGKKGILIIWADTCLVSVREMVRHGFQGGIRGGSFQSEGPWPTPHRYSTIDHHCFAGFKEEFIQEKQGFSPNIPREEICTNKVPLGWPLGARELALLSSPKFSFSRLHPSLVKSFGETIILIGEP